MVQRSVNLYYLFMVLATLGWGLSWPIGKILVGIAPPLTIGFFRFFFAFCCFLPILLWKYSPIRYTRRNLRNFLLLGLTGAFGYGVFFLVGLNFTTAAQGSIIAGANPAIVSLFAHYFLKERLQQTWQYLGFGISFLGIIFVIGVQSLLDFRLEYLIGNLLVLMAMVCWGLYTNLSKLTMQDGISAFEATAGGVFMGMIFFGIGSILEGVWDLSALNSMTFWSGVLILGAFVTFMSFTLYFVSVASIGPTRAAIFINLVPIFGTIFSTILLQEEILWTFVIGLILIIAGIFVINFPNNEE
ncbi:MAG: DMT family transporter [Candidatus Heimdallarchaeota archaeon]